MKKCLLVSMGFVLLSTDAAAIALGQETSPQSTITLEQAVHFLSPDGAEIVLAPGDYTAKAPDGTSIQVTPISGGAASIIQAEAGRHGQELSAPELVAAASDEDVIHIVLLMPDGSTLDAIGTLSGVRTRGPMLAPLQAQQLAGVMTMASRIGKALIPLPGGGVAPAMPQVSGERQLAPRLPMRALAPPARLCVDLPGPAGQLPPKMSGSSLSIMHDGSVVGVNRGPLASIPDRMWERGQTLRVRFIGGSDALRARVKRYAEEWRPHGNVRFDWIGDSSPAEIRISFAQTNASWSYIGRDALLMPANEATMNFGWFTDDTSDEEVRRTTLHEFGHVLGLIHEHQSPVAGIQWDRPKVYEWYSKNLGWDQATVDANVLTKLSASSTNYTVYDPTSIMQYPVPASLTLDGREIGWNKELSRMDKAGIRAWYPFPTVSLGQLRTGDDCDAINFSVKEGVAPPGQLLVRLGTSGPVNWWKSIKIPFGNGGLHEIAVGGPMAESRWTFWRSILDESRPIRFSKAKFLGVHTELGFTWDILKALPDGGELHLVWVKDSCSQ
jgi:hypothetical protein